jgi:hypothetical protein
VPMIFSVTFACYLTWMTDIGFSCSREPAQRKPIARHSLPHRGQRWTTDLVGVPGEGVIERPDSAALTASQPTQVAVE